MLDRIIGIIIPWILTLVMIGVLFFIFPGLALVLILFGFADLETHADNHDNQDYY